VFSRTAIAVSACADFVVEGAVNLVLFGSEDGGEISRHFEVVRSLSGRNVKVVALYNGEKSF